MFDFGFWEIALIGLITLIVVGPERLPALATKAGQYMNKVRHFLTDIKSQVDENTDISQHIQEIEDLKSHLSFEDEKHSILEIVEQSKKTIAADPQTKPDKHTQN